MVKYRSEDMGSFSKPARIDLQIKSSTLQIYVPRKGIWGRQAADRCHVVMCTVSCLTVFDAQQVRGLNYW